MGARFVSRSCVLLAALLILPLSLADASAEDFSREFDTNIARAEGIQHVENVNHNKIPIPYMPYVDIGQFSSIPMPNPDCEKQYSAEDDLMTDETKSSHHEQRYAEIILLSDYETY